MHKQSVLEESRTFRKWFKNLTDEGFDAKAEVDELLRIEGLVEKSRDGRSNDAAGTQRPLFPFAANLWPVKCETKSLYKHTCRYTLTVQGK